MNIDICNLKDIIKDANENQILEDQCKNQGDKSSLNIRRDREKN